MSNPKTIETVRAVDGGIVGYIRRHAGYYRTEHVSGHLEARREFEILDEARAYLRGVADGIRIVMRPRVACHVHGVGHADATPVYDAALGAVVPKCPECLRDWNRARHIVTATAPLRREGWQ